MSGNLEVRSRREFRIGAEEAIAGKERCQKFVGIFLTVSTLRSETGIHFSDKGRARMDLKSQIQKRMAAQAPFGVWTPTDFLDIGSRDAIDQALSRMTSAGEIRRITRGLYDLPRPNSLTGKPTNPDPRRVIDALVRRDQARMLVDGLTAANDLGLTDAVPAKISVHTDARLRPIKLGAQTITFKLTAPSRLHWAGRPAMRVVQALQWLRSTIDTDRDRIHRRLAAILADPDHGAAIVADLREGFTSLPDWMQNFLRPLLDEPPSSSSRDKPTKRQPGSRR